MKYCGYCLNHGFRIYNWKEHIDSCSLRRCVCRKCREVALEEGEQSLDSNIASTSTQNTSMDRSVTKASTSTDSQQINFELISDPMEDVKSLANELSKSDISEKDLQTCVLYALLESNHFSITETRKQLFHSRNAITESLILPAFNVNRELNLKRPPSPQNESNRVKTSFKKLCPLNTKAKKSFPRNRSATNDNSSKTNTSLKTPIKDISVQTNSKQPKGLRNELMGNFDETTSSTLTTRKERESKTSPLNISPNCSTKEVNSAQNEMPVIKPFERSAINSNTVIESVAHSNKKPIQSVRPLSNSSALPTKLVSVTSSAIPSSEASISSKNSLVETTPKLGISSANFYSESHTKKEAIPQKNVARSILSSNNSPQKRLKTAKPPESDLNGVESNHFPPNLGPKIKTYSKMNSNKSLKSRSNGLIVELNDQIQVENSVEQSLKSDINFDFEPDIETPPPKQIQLCAKIITPEAALVALSAIPPTTTSSPHLLDNTLENSSVVDSHQLIEEIKEEFTPNNSSEHLKPLETSYSNQFKLFLSNLKNTALNPLKTNSDNNSSNAKEVIEITID